MDKALASANVSYPERRFDLDWLRVLAVLLLVPFHSALVFVQNPAYIVYLKDQVQSDLLMWLANFIALWHMPLLFAIAGASTWFALGRRTPGQYLKERLLRLLVPCLFGIFTLIPLMTYIHWFNQPDRPSFWEHYLRFLQINPADFSGTAGTFTPGHLWFIMFLFVFSIVALPLFAWLKAGRGARLASVLAAFFKYPGVLLLLFVPLALISLLPLMGNMNPAYYILVFVLGFILMMDDCIQETIQRDGWIYLFLSLVVTALFFWVRSMQLAQGSFGWAIGFGAYNFSRWAWVLVILSFGRRGLNFNSPLLRYCSEAAYPFYILHLPVNTLVSFFVTQWNVGVALKYVSINFLTIALTLLVYDLVVRRTNLTRILFGMKRIYDRNAPVRKTGLGNLA